MKSRRLEQAANLGGLVLMISAMTGLLLLILIVAGPESGGLAYLAIIPWLGLLLMMLPTIVECWKDFRGGA